MITVFTSTYNRAHRISDLYKSLLRQTSKDFEWIVVDDGSTDETKELIRMFKKECNSFSIIYARQVHGGKHRAINKGLELASGEYFFMVDSDDELFPDAIESIERWIRGIKNKKGFAGVSGMCLQRGAERPKGQEERYVDATNFEREKYGLLGDMSEVYRTNLLRKHKFPEFEGEFFVTEDVCYQEIAGEGYKIRWYNKPIYIREYLNDGLTKNGANSLSGHVENIKGFSYWVKRALRLQPFRRKYLILKEYWMACSALDKNVREQARGIEMSVLKYMFYLIFIIPLSYILNGLTKLWWKIKGKK